MARFDHVAARFYDNLARRADAVVHAQEAGKITDFGVAAWQSYEDEIRELDAHVNKAAARRLPWILLGSVVVLGLGIAAGVATENFLTAAVIIGPGCLLLGRLVPSQDAITAAKQNGPAHFDACIRAALSAAEERAEQQREAMLAPARQSLAQWQALHAHPPAQPYGVSALGAESWVRDWMVHMGAEGSTVTRFSGDGGIDVENPHFVAQVKHYTGAVGVAAIREHIGVARVDAAQRRPLFFTSASYAAGALDAADRAEMPLFLYSVEEGVVTAANSLAGVLLEIGLNPAWWPKA